MSGVLHDIGRLALAISDPIKFSAFRCDRRGMVSISDEIDFFGLSHQDAGDLLARNWNFPDSVATAIAKHHTPNRVEPAHTRLAATVWMADVLAHTLSIGNSGTEYVTEFYPEVWASLGVTTARLETVLTESLAEIRSMGKILTD